MGIELQKREVLFEMLFELQSESLFIPQTEPG